jgi:probable HAF family extracellular repeat protein
MKKLLMIGSIVLLPFVTKTQDQNYYLIDLGILGGSGYAYSVATGINNLGQVVGHTTTSGNVLHAFLYQNGSMQDLGNLGGNYDSLAFGINDAGQIVGYAAISGNTQHAFLYSNGSMQDIGTLGGDYGIANGINSRGQIVGQAATNSSIIRAFLYQNGSMENLGTFDGQSGASGINDSGQVVGYSATNNYDHAFLYSDGSMHDLGTLGGITSHAKAINAGGQVVGYANVSNSTGWEHAFLYSDGSMQDLGTLGGQGSDAYGINNSGQVVGIALTSAGNYEAFLYQNGSMYNLNNYVINTNLGFTLVSANAINDLGQIVGEGDVSGQPHAFLLNPLPLGWKETISAEKSQLTYGICPTKEPGKDNLIVITHGWNSKVPNPIFTPDVSWIDNMSNNISGYLVSHGLVNWQVYGYKWVNNSWTLLPANALANANKEGSSLGKSIATQGWTHVHFIAYSAGSGLIQVATDEIKNPTSGSPATVVHETFLDAYVGPDYAGVTNYGKGANWSDQYFTRDKLTQSDPNGNLLKLGFYTESFLTNAYNVDVTALDPHKTTYPKFASSASGAQLIESCHETLTTHGWPIDFYTNTIVGNTDSSYEGFGFVLSEEAGKLDFAKSQYPPGNNPAHLLGIPDAVCTIVGEIRPTSYLDTLPDFAKVPLLDSLTGTVEKLPKSLHLHSGSPVWTAAFITSTNPLNFVSFDAEFTDTNSSQGMLSVYWDSETIGIVDERVVQPGFQHYIFTFPNAIANTTHMLGFRLDPFTNVQSSILLTNITLNQVGVSQPFSLSITTNLANGLPVYRLDGQAGFNYIVQASTNLIVWNDIAILVNTNGSVFFYDQDSVNHRQRFYRTTAAQ